LRLALEELKKDNETVLELEGVTVVYKPEIAVHLEGVSIDYSDKWYEKGLILKFSRKSGC
jgi:Fe-S cluster assembly iron-binding protein IscA